MKFDLIRGGEVNDRGKSKLWTCGLLKLEKPDRLNFGWWSMFSMVVIPFFVRYSPVNRI